MNVEYSERDVVSHFIHKPLMRGTDACLKCDSCGDDIEDGDEIFVVSWTPPLDVLRDGVFPAQKFTRHHLYCQADVGAAQAKFSEFEQGELYERKDLVLFKTEMNSRLRDNGVGFGNVQLVERSPPELD